MHKIINKWIRLQPGYRAGCKKMIAKSSAGGYRLYCDINGGWMDASLSDAYPIIGKLVGNKPLYID